MNTQHKDTRTISPVFQKWIQMLPRLIWEVGDKNSETTRIILNVFEIFAKKRHSDLKVSFFFLPVNLIIFLFRLILTN